LAEYNRWANRRLYQACAEAGDAEILARRPAFFGSILGTFNHILVADRLWFARFEGRREEGIAALDQILFDRFADLRQAREAFDDRIIAAIGELDGDPGRLFSYLSIKGEPSCQPLNLVLGHVFNHQTHHRGQVHGMLSQTAVAPPSLDLAYFLR